MLKPIISVVGHVDVGKTSFLDYFSKSKTKEIGGITQEIRTSEYSADEIKSKFVIDSFVKNFNMDGVVFIDTPGHDYFKSQREVTTNISHMAILIIDVVHGINQTHIEVIKYFKKNKIDFIIALNKIDTISEWKSMKDSYLKTTFQSQSKIAMKRLTDYMSSIICQLAEQEINAAPYYANNDYKTFTSIVPISAKSGEGMMDIMILLSKLLNKKYSQLTKNITYNNIAGYFFDLTTGTYGKGYKYIHISNTPLKNGDTINIFNKSSTQIKHILYNSSKVTEITQPGVYILVLDSSSIDCGDVCIFDTDKSKTDFESMYTCNILTLDSVSEEFVYDDDGELVKTVSKNDDATIELNKIGIGIIALSKSMEKPLYFMFSQMNVPVSLILNEKLTKTHVIKVANSNKTKDLLENIKFQNYRAIVIFDPTYANEHSKLVDDEVKDFAKRNSIEIIFSDTIYKLKTSYLNYTKTITSKIKTDYGHLADIHLEILPQFVFMKTTPLLFGVKVKRGELKIGTNLGATKNGKTVFLGKVMGIQHEKDKREKATVNEEVCIRVVLETGKVVYKVDFDETYEIKTYMSKDDMKIYKMFKDEIESK
jgi:translation initiation factor 5B